MDATRTVSMLFVAVALAVAVPTSALAQTERVSLTQYVETVCATVMSKVKPAEEVLESRAVNPGLANFAPSPQAAIDIVDAYQKVWIATATTLGTVSPDVGDGETVRKLFVDYATRGVDELQKAIDTFKGAVPNSPTYLAKLTNFAVVSMRMRRRLENPLKLVTDSSVRAAFDRVKTCADLFPIRPAAGPIDPRVRITEFLIPTAETIPFGITVGPDGHVWFTEGAANQIGRIDPVTGKVTEFRVPTANARPRNITMGPDGHVWFTEQIGRQIGKINPATGVVTELPTPNASPGSITGRS